MWHVKLTLAGPVTESFVVRRAMQRLAEERPFLTSLRYSADRVEICYWDEAGSLVDAASLALRLWGQHRDTANLPPWEVVGLEVRDRDLAQGTSTFDSAEDLLAVPLLF